MSDVLPGPLAGLTPGAGVMGLARRPALRLISQDQPVSQATVEEAPEDFPARAAQLPFNGNLAEVLPDQLLAEIAQRIIEGIDADIQSNNEHRERYNQGLELLGLDPLKRVDQPFENASGVHHNLMKHALLNFRASAIKELLPASGPVRTEIIGDVTPDLEAQAQRKQDYMNFYLTVEDEDYYPDFNQMVLLLGLWGSMFRHVWRDPLRGGKPISRYLSPKDLVVNYNATSLNGQQRVTRVEYNVPFSDIRRLQLNGWYRNIVLHLPTAESELAEDDARRVTEHRTPTELDQDKPYEICHCHCVLDIAGLDHRDPETGEETGLPLPYIVTLNRDSQKILRLARNWRQQDPTFRPIECYVHYRYLPGDGFLGWGLPHIIGSDTYALTTLLRMAINSNMLVSFPGGFRAQGIAKTESNRIKVGPGEFALIDTGGLPINQAIMPLPYRDVPGSFPTIMEALLDSAQRVASIGDMAVGEGREDALPGTVIALIEKATKLESAVIADQHISQRKELRLLAELFGEGDGVYPYTINGRRGQALAPDFADNSDVVPVSDPNIPTQTQRLAQAQAVLQLAQASGGAIAVKPAYEKFLRTLGLNDGEITALMPPTPQAQPADPVSEFQSIMQRQPVIAGPMQDHAAHIQAHIAQMAAPGLSKTPMGAALQDHISDHVAKFYAAQAGALTGMPIQPGQPLPPQIEAQVAAAVAAASNQLAIQLQQLAPQQGQDPTAMAKIQADVLKTHQQEQDSQRKDQQSARTSQLDAMREHGRLVDAEKQRAHDMQMALIQSHDVQTKARADMIDATLSHSADLQNARHETMQHAVDASAAVDTNRANVKVAEHEATAAEAEARKAQAAAKAAAAKNRG